MSRQNLGSLTKGSLLGEHGLSFELARRQKADSSRQSNWLRDGESIVPNRILAIEQRADFSIGEYEGVRAIYRAENHFVFTNNARSDEG